MALPVEWENAAMVVLAMSHGELSRFDPMMRVERGELRVADAAALFGLKRRQVYRLLDRLREDRAERMISRKCGRRRSNASVDALPLPHHRMGHFYLAETTDFSVLPEHERMSGG